MLEVVRVDLRVNLPRSFHLLEQLARCLINLLDLLLSFSINHRKLLQVIISLSTFFCRRYNLFASSRSKFNGLKPNWRNKSGIDILLVMHNVEELLRCYFYVVFWEQLTQLCERPILSMSATHIGLSYGFQTVRGSCGSNLFFVQGKNHGLCITFFGVHPLCFYRLH